MSFRIVATWVSRIVLTGLLGAGAVSAEVAIKVDHTDVDLFESIPDSYLAQIRQMTIQYNGQSHGRQVPYGLELLAAMDSKYSVQQDWNFDNLTATDALKVQRSIYRYTLGNWLNYLTVDDDSYWSTPYGRACAAASASEAISQGQPFTVTIWCWCWDLWRTDWVHNESGTAMTFNDERMSTYLSNLSTLNSNSSLNPTVFVYHTAVSDDPGNGEDGWKITRYNDQIRQAASANNGILFDQADIENWNNTNTAQRIDTWDGHTLYLRHTDYNQNVGVPFTTGHTNEALCIRKAKALWVLLAKMSGWDGGTAVDPELHLTSPNGGESLTAGEQHSITWLSSDISAIDIEFSSNNGSSWSTVASDVSVAGGSYSWTVPSVVSTQCLIRLTESSTGSVTDTSTQTFTISLPAADPELYLTSPNGAENLTAGEQHSITWLSSDISAIDIEFSSNNGSSWSTVASDVNVTGGSYSWTVPSVASTQCRIRLTESSSGSVTDTSTQTFTISVPVTAIWGDVDDDEAVTVADALKVATYDIDPGNAGIAGILAFITARGDVNADASINSTDALICASYEVYPDNPHNPARVGNTIGSVPKPAVEPVADALPALAIVPDGTENIRLSPSVTASSLGVEIGASTVRITWDPAVFSFVVADDPSGSTLVNSDAAASGTLLLARFNTGGEESFSFPQLTFHANRAPDAAAFTMDVLNAAVAGSFETLATDHSSVNVPVAVEDDAPGSFSLAQNVPNPFNPVTSIRFTLEQSGLVNLDVYNIQGQLVTRLVDGFMSAGQHAVQWDGTDDRSGRAASGIYLYQIRANGNIARRQMVLLR